MLNSKAHIRYLCPRTSIRGIFHKEILSSIYSLMFVSLSILGQQNRVMKITKIESKCAKKVLTD